MRRTEVRKPQFDADDKLSQAWQQGKIGVDEYVRYSVERIARPENLPEKLRPEKGVVPHEVGLSLAYALSLAQRQASPETKAWLKETLKQPDPTAMSSIASVLAAGQWKECTGDYTFVWHHFSCLHRFSTTTDFEIYYNVDGVGGEDGLQAIDLDGNGIPDGVDAMSNGLTTAWQLYKSWGYGHTGQSVSVYFGFDFGGNNPGFTFPFGGLLDAGPAILLPTDPGDPLPGETARRDWKYTYLSYHEMFHGMQYHYLSNDDFLVLNLTSINWWMEATAEWATHEVFKPGFDR